MAEPHTLRSFDEALDGLSAALFKMGEKVCAMINHAGKVVQEIDAKAAAHPVEADLAIDRHFEDIREKCIETLMQCQLLARNLRQIMAVEQAVGDLERAADHAKDIAKKRVISSPSGALSGPHVEMFGNLAVAALGAMEDALDDFVRRDIDLAVRVTKGDRAVDALHDDLFLTVIAGLRSSDQAVQDVQFLFAAKNLERIGDHATDIAEEAMFMKRVDQSSATRTETS